jgi:predicted nucleotidyltransferase
MTSLEKALCDAGKALREAGKSFALVGGLAVSARTEPRFTRDADLAVAVAGDADAEGLVVTLRAAGYRVGALVEHDVQKRLATVRLISPGNDAVIVDLLFASSGIEAEIVAAAESIEVFEGVHLPVARVGHLIAQKVLSRDDRERPQDVGDLRALLRVASDEELQLARQSIADLTARGFSRGRDLVSLLAAALVDFRGTATR